MMAYPTKSAAHYDYESFQAASPTMPLPADHVDNDFANLKTAVDATIDFLKGIVTPQGIVNVGNMPGAQDLAAFTATATAAAAAAAASATAAGGSATSAAASAAAAALSGATLTASSTTSLLVGTGAQSLTVQTARQFANGAFLLITRTSDPTNTWMFGQVTSYNAGTGALVVGITAIKGSGTFTDWTVNLSGTQGATGSPGAAGAAGATGATGANGVDGTAPIASVIEYYGRALPAGYAWANGGTLLRSAAPLLFAALVLSGTVTMTIATPGVVTWTGHILQNGDPVKFATTGALPTGIIAGTTYYALSVATNTFRVSATPHGAAINTSGSQSGVHTAISAAHGDGDGSTTFNVPDRRGNSAVGHDVMFASAANRTTWAGSANDGNSIGKQIGEQAHTLIAAEQASLPVSTALSAGSGLISGTDVASAAPNGQYSLTGSGAATGTATGGGGAHNNTHAGIVCYYIIKAA